MKELKSCKHAAQSRPRHKHLRPLLFLWGWRHKEPFDVKAEINIKLPVDEKREEVLNNWRKHNSNASKLCLEGMIQGKRSRGRPKRRWRDNIFEWTPAENWTSINQFSLDRVLWRNLSYVGSQSATSGRSDPWWWWRAWKIKSAIYTLQDEIYEFSFINISSWVASSARCRLRTYIR